MLASCRHPQEVIFQTRIHMSHCSLALSYLVFFERVQVYACLWNFKFKFFFHVINRFSLSLMDFKFPCFILELFCFFYIQLLICSCALPSMLSVNCYFIILECPVLFDPIPVSFESTLFFQLHGQSYLRLAFWDLFLSFDSCAFYFSLWFRLLS